MNRPNFSQYSDQSFFFLSRQNQDLLSDFESTSETSSPVHKKHITSWIAFLGILILWGGCLWYGNAQFSKVNQEMKQVMGKELLNHLRY